MKRRSRILLLGLALVLLLGVVVEVVALWPMPCEAEEEAGVIRPGMTPTQVQAIVNTLPENERRHVMVPDPGEIVGLVYDDGSFMDIVYEGEKDSRRVSAVQINQPPPVPPTEALRRTLDRMLPFRAE